MSDWDNDNYEAGVDFAEQPSRDVPAGHIDSGEGRAVPSLGDYSTPPLSRPCAHCGSAAHIQQYASDAGHSVGAMDVERRTVTVEQVAEALHRSQPACYHGPEARIPQCVQLAEAMWTYWPVVPLGASEVEAVAHVYGRAAAYADAERQGES